MRAFVVNLILCILTHVWIQDVLSSVSRTRQKRTWIIEYLTMKRGSMESLKPSNPLKFKSVDYKVSGKGIDVEPKIFRINNFSGCIDVLQQTGYENIKNFTLTFTSITTDEDKKQKLGLVINIEELYEPFFTEAIQRIKANEKTKQGTELVRLDNNNEKYNSAVYRIVSVTPTPSSFKFILKNESQPSHQHFISFWGCLDFEANKEYTIQLAAEGRTNFEGITPTSDATVKVNLIDNNDNLPKVLEILGNGHVKESEIGAVVYTIRVSDEDSQGSTAWRAVFKVHGEGSEHFKIETDPATNNGNMIVIRALDYEVMPRLNLTVQMENEEPFFSCMVQKVNDGKPWNVAYSEGSNSTSINIGITVEDVNDPPEFMDTIKHVTILENSPVGQSLWTFTAKDQDQHSIRIIKGKDVDNWVTANVKSGLVSTAKVLDRESRFVSNNTYTVILYAIDNGTPQMTGTATLIIHLTDLNDNVPVLKVDKLYMCSSSSKSSITAEDPDLPPLGAPFIYELQGHDSRDWRIEPTHGKTVNLVKDSDVHSGIHHLTLKITDSEGQASIQNLSITVCDCSFRDTCQAERRNTVRSGVGMTSTILVSIVLMLCLLLMTCKVSCKSELKSLSDDKYPESVLLHSNSEAPGTDVDSLSLTQNMAQYREKAQCKISKEKNCIINEKVQYQDMQTSSCPNEISNTKAFQVWNLMNKNQADCDPAWITTINITTKNFLSLKLPTLYQEEYSHDEFITYASEGECDSGTELDSISIPESGFSLTDIKYLDARFKPLAAKCRPDLIL